jgi:hypothetical protein
MYQIAFKEFGYKLPFIDFEVAVFNHLRLAPSQLHPNSLAFLRAFEVVATYFNIVPTLKLFFFAFRLQRSKPKGDAENKYGWVSFTQKRCLFEMFEESVRGYKDKFFMVFPKDDEAWKSIVTRGPQVDDNGAVVEGPDGNPVIVDHSRFPFKWERNHYLMLASSFIYQKKEFDAETIADYQALCDFVDGFVP